jgi:UDP:flavonoid glycosyltransferase YjiC (YdhE family)
VFIPREFQPAGDSFDERFCFLSPLLGHREQREPWSPLDPAAPLLYISLGTIFTDRPDFYRTCLEAFGDGTWQIAMTVGEMDPALLGPVPRPSRYNRGFRNRRCYATLPRSSPTPT